MRDLKKEFRSVIITMLSSSKYMFYGYFLSDINKYFDKNTPTASIGKHSTASIPELRIGNEFWEKYLDNKSKRMYIILHELGHLINEHIYSESRTLYPDKNVSNMAMDMYINCGITEESPVDENGNRMGVHYDSFPTLKLKKDESTMYYYRELMKAKDKKKESSNKGQDSKNPGQQPGNGMGTTGDPNLDAQLESEENVHITWEEFTDGLSEIEKNLLKKQITQIIKNSAEETQKSKGDVPVNIEGYLTEVELTEAVIPWGSLFKRFIGSVLSLERQTTRKRPNFRFPEAPAQKMKTKLRGVVLCDSSGSMSDYDIDEINSQLYWIWKSGVAVDFASWDAECEKAKEYDGKLTFERTKSGGTRLGCATEYVNENYKKEGWAFAVIGTDGYVESNPTHCKIPTIIVITNEGNADVNVPHKIVKIQK